MKTIVISAVNLRKGGTLSILNDCLKTLATMSKEQQYRIVALVHKKELAYHDGIEYVEIPWSTRSWLHRLWCEYVTMYDISKRIGNIYLWLSLHDTTPRVEAKHIAVYCHNPFPFFSWKWQHLFLNYKIVCFALFSRWIYRINIHKNDYVIVQQDWLRNSFVKMFDLDSHRLIVAPPSANHLSIEEQQTFDGIYRFIYPAYPDVHKNMECLCKATQLLEKEVGKGRFEVLLTVDKDYNAYSHWLFKKWGHVASLKFCGFMSKSRLYEFYAASDCLVFPSKVETWGLPISEFAVTHRPMLLSDLPYAHETAQQSKQTAFFPPDAPAVLMQLMKKCLEGDTAFLNEIDRKEIACPYARDWNQLLNLLIKNENTAIGEVLPA